MPDTTHFKLLLKRVADRQLSIAIVGMGYAGLPLALSFAQAGFRVVGFDIDQNKIDHINAGRSYISHIENGAIQSARKLGFRGSISYKEAGTQDVIIVCVPTPLNKSAEPDMSFIITAISNLAPHMRDRQLLVLESTTYPGTTEELVIPLVIKHGPTDLKIAFDELTPGIFVSYSPEREDPGNTTVDRKAIPKIIGACGSASLELSIALYGSIFDNLHPVSSTTVAEMSKLLENIYRCVNIALVNELKQLCIRMGINIWDVIEAAKSKPFGFQAFYPGPGLGGHCIPIDPFYLSWKAKQYDFRTHFIELAGKINADMPHFVTDTVANSLEHFNQTIVGAKILILGAAYKRDVDDTRESPALAIIDLLKKRGADVDYNDPLCAQIVFGDTNAAPMRSVNLDHISSYDCVVIVTDHSSYDWPAIVERSRIVVDTRNATGAIKDAKIFRC